jgi:3-methyladenine DNA glycosylase AlkD
LTAWRTTRSTKAVSNPDLPAGVEAAVTSALKDLEKLSTKRDFDNLERFGITASKAFGVSVANIQVVARRLGRDHALADALWKSGWYEARMLASFVDEPDRVTPAQMDRWCRDFDNWGICDTICFHLFDRTPHAWKNVLKWHDWPGEFQKRAAFALLASLALHDKRTGDQPFLDSLSLIEHAATDDRNFVKKGVSWALRLIGRRNVALNAAAVTLSRRLATAAEPSARWIGRTAVKELTSAMVLRRLAATASRSAKRRAR